MTETFHIPCNYVRKLGPLPLYEVFVVTERPDGVFGGAYGFIQVVWGRRRAERAAGQGGTTWVNL